MSGRPPIYERGVPQLARERIRIALEREAMARAMDLLLFGECYEGGSGRLVGLVEITARPLDDMEPAWLDRALRENGFRA